MNNKRQIITDILGSYRRAGDEHLYHCPFCKHHKKKMSVNFSINSYKCWVCDARGKNIYRLVRKFGNYQQRQKYLELQGRLDLSERELAEIKVIEEFLPRQLTDSEIQSAVSEAINEVGASSIRDMGKVMAALKSKYAGQMDFGATGALVKNDLSS